MIVTYAGIEESPLFVKGNFYRPLEVLFSKSGPKFRLQPERGGTVVIRDGKDFRIIDNRIYTPLVMMVQAEGEAILTNKEFAPLSFWVDFFENQPEALRLFYEVTKGLAGIEVSPEFQSRILNADSTSPRPSDIHHHPDSALLLLAWGYENQKSLRDPYIFLEDIYLEKGLPKWMESFVPFLHPQLNLEDFMVSWKRVLEERVYEFLLKP